MLERIRGGDLGVAPRTESNAHWPACQSAQPHDSEKGGPLAENLPQAPQTRD
jgi:hypothetical protein